MQNASAADVEAAQPDTPERSKAPPLFSRLRGLTSPSQVISLLQERIGTALRAGATPHNLARSIAVGVCMGLCPVPGVTTLACTLLAYVFSLHMATVQAVQLSMWGVQLAALAPLAWLGAWALGSQAVPFSVEEFAAAAQLGFVHILRTFWMVVLQATAAWAALFVPLYLAIYNATLPLLRRWFVGWKRRERRQTTLSD